MIKRNEFKVNNIEKIYSWTKLNEGEYGRKMYDAENERVFLLRKEPVGVLGMGKCYHLLVRLVSESEFKHVTCIVYGDDNHGLQLHDDVDKYLKAKKLAVITTESEEEIAHLMFDIAEKYIDCLY